MAKKGNILLETAKTGNSQAKAPLLINNNWVDRTSKAYSSFITCSFCRGDDWPKIGELERLRKAFLKTQKT